MPSLEKRRRRVAPTTRSPVAHGGAGGAFHSFAGLALCAEGPLQSSRVPHARWAARRSRRGSRTRCEPLVAVVEGAARPMSPSLHSDTGLPRRADGSTHSSSLPPLGVKGSLHCSRRLPRGAEAAFHSWRRPPIVRRVCRSFPVDRPTVRGVSCNLSIGRRRCGGCVAPGPAVSGVAPALSGGPGSREQIEKPPRRALGGTVQEP